MTGHATEPQHSEMALTYHISESVLAQIRSTIGQLPAETGGILGGDRSRREVTRFYFDTTSRRSSATYSPDCGKINHLLKHEWNPANIDLIGVVHSHPAGFRKPSGGDLDYAKAILDHNEEMKHFLLPIILPSTSGQCEVLPYAVFRDRDQVRVEEIDLISRPEVDEFLQTQRELKSEFAAACSIAIGAGLIVYGLCACSSRARANRLQRRTIPGRKKRT